MKQSEQITELAGALVKARPDFKPIIKTAINPFFKSRYAPLDEVIAATTEALSANGLSIVQLPEADGLTTMLLHVSGQYVTSVYPIKPVKEDPQGMGAAITYARRYALSAILGVASEEDDDAETTRPTKQSITKKDIALNPSSDALFEEIQSGSTPEELIKQSMAQAQAQHPHISVMRSKAAMAWNEIAARAGVKPKDHDYLRHIWTATFYVGKVGFTELNENEMYNLYRFLSTPAAGPEQLAAWAEKKEKILKWIEIQKNNLPDEEK